jgi:hypothetical protein
MSDRKDYYFRQNVTEGELDGGFNDLEVAQRAMIQDLGLVGVSYGLAITQAIVPNLTVLVSGPGAAYDQTGRRCAFVSNQSLNVALDENGITTAVATPGNTKILSVFIEFDRTLSDPRLDGNAATVFFERDESFSLNVVQGAEGIAPVAPALRSDQILLGDITLSFGQTAVINANVSTARREWAFRASGAVTIAVGTAEEAIQGLVAALTSDALALSNHLADAVDAHDASAISSIAAGNLSSTTVQAALNELDNEKLAISGVSTMTGTLDMGSQPIINAGSISATGFAAGVSFTYSPAPTRTISIPLAAIITPGSGWIPDPANPGEYITDGAIWNQTVWFDLLRFLPDGAIFQSLTVVWEQTAGFATNTDQMSAKIMRHQQNFSTLAATITSMAGTTYYGTGTGKKSVLINPADFQIDKLFTTACDSGLLLEIDAAAGGVSRLAALRLSFTDPGPSNL